MSDTDDYKAMQKNFAQLVENTESAMGRGQQPVIGMTARQQVWMTAFQDAVYDPTGDEVFDRATEADRVLAAFDKRFGGAT